MLFSDHGGPVNVTTAVLAQHGAEYDPGILAFLGAAAFLAGSGRIILFVTVMFVEITGDRYMIMPVSIATFVAYFVGRRGALCQRAVGGTSEVLVRDIVDANCKVDVIDVAAGREMVEQTLQNSQHHAFPVVNSLRNVVGIVDRDDLEKLLDPSDESMEFETGEEVGLEHITNFHNITITMHSPLELAFSMFKKMEMRHLIVVNDSDAHPVTVLARRDLLPWVVERRLGRVHADDDEFEDDEDDEEDHEE